MRTLIACLLGLLFACGAKAPTSQPTPERCTAALQKMDDAIQKAPQESLKKAIETDKKEMERLIQLLTESGKSAYDMDQECGRFRRTAQEAYDLARDQTIKR